MPANTNQEQPRELLTVVVPCFNEQDTVEDAVRSIYELAPSLPVDLQVLLIDDGSTDGTKQKMEGLCRNYPACRMKVHPKNVGLGAAVTGSYNDIAPGSWVTVVPGDNEFLFESILNFMEVRNRYDVILGYFQNPVIRTLSRRLASYFFMKTVQFLYGFPYRYLNGMKMYRVDAFRGIEVLSRGHAFNAELLAKALLRNPRLRIGEAQFVWIGRPSVGGSSKAVRPGSILRSVWEVFKGHRSVGRYRKAVLSGMIPQREVSSVYYNISSSAPKSNHE